MKVPYTTKGRLVKSIKNFSAMTPLIRRAIAQAVKTHKNQARDDGGPYLEQHIYPIAIDIINYYKSEYPDDKVPENLIAGALLHDTLEDDTEITKKQFIKLFGEEVYGIVHPLTKPEHDPGMSQKDMIALNKSLWINVISKGGYCLLIKLADRTNNMESFYAFKNLDFPKFYRYMQEVEEQYLPYAKKNNDYFYKRLFDVISELKKK